MYILVTTNSEASLNYINGA